MLNIRNPPAFPVKMKSVDGSSSTYLGMTLRDYFAAKAMAALITTPLEDWPKDLPISTSAAAYKIADAMLGARNV